jgi:transcription-repair coupling factor (superfamily II helicase)
VVNLERILELYRSDARILALTEKVNAYQPEESGKNSTLLQLSGLEGAQESFVLAGTYLACSRPQLWIANDKEEAAYFYTNLVNLLEKKPIHFFPDSFKRPQYYEQLNNSNVLERNETINKIITQSRVPFIIVTYPEAIFEKVVEPTELESSRILLNTGEKVDIDILIDLLIDYGFTREDFVYEPGQFSLRGAIIDVFSYGNEYPYRIELFDEDIESIRTFDPMTQLSVSNIARLAIVPNLNTRFRQDQKVSLLQILDNQTQVWVKDIGILVDRLQSCFEKAEAFSKSLPLLDTSELSDFFKERAFVPPGRITVDLLRFPFISVAPVIEHIKLLPANVQLDRPIHFNGRSQPSFNKNFDLLIENLNQNSVKGFTNFIFTDNPKQIERFHAIFEDMGVHVKFEPVVKSISEGFIDEDLKIACYTDHQIFQRHHHYRIKQGFTPDKALSFKLLKELQPGDYVVHIDHGVGKYSGLEKITVNGHTQESVRIFYKNNDVLYISINALHKLSRFTSKDGTPPNLSKLGSDAWQNLKRKTKKQVKDIAKELIKLYALRKASKGYAFSEDNYLQAELEASFIYEDTPDQEKASLEVKSDMMKSYPMDRLICGDVGFGKTEIAIRAAFKSALDGKQTAVLVPTTILALQHFNTFSERLKEFNLKIEYINRFKSTAEKKEVFENLKAGKLDIIIGTHGLLNKMVEFKDLGLLIVDEEQKFGVAAKEKLRSLKHNVDTLTLTATPIPRTLQFSLMAARDLSIIRTPPPNRQPIHTEIRVFSEQVIKDAIYKEISRGGQVFFVHNRVKTLPDIAGLIKRLCPDIEVAMAHGQLDSDSLEKTLLGFINREFDVLVCTNIIETGLDIPNANTMIINDAHQFGLSDLHQLRGRIGRSNKKAYCYLFCPPVSVLTSEARKRLRTIEEFSDLGSGFEIAMRDLDIRGAGNLLGAEQSGFIADIGYETFQRILEEAIQELKESDFKDLFQEELSKQNSFVRDVQIDTDTEMHIPDEYVSSVSERLSLYTDLDKIEDEAGLEKFESELKDRFGKLPAPVYELFDGLRLRWTAQHLGFERIILKEKKLRCFFVENPQSRFYDSLVFQKIFSFIANHGDKHGLSIKKTPKSLILIKESVASLKKAQEVLRFLKNQL